MIHSLGFIMLYIQLAAIDIAKILAMCLNSIILGPLIDHYFLTKMFGLQFCNIEFLRVIVDGFFIHINVDAVYAVICV